MAPSSSQSTVTLWGPLEYLLKLSPLIIPLFVVGFGFWINKRIASFTAKKQVDHTVMEKRTSIYENIQSELNELYCYLMRIGDWKEFTPEQILQKKRTVDKAMYAGKPFWSVGLFSSYTQFMDTCFLTHRGHGKDAGIRANINRYNSLGNWENRFVSFFEEAIERDIISEKFKELEISFSIDFGVS